MNQVQGGDVQGEGGEKVIEVDGLVKRYDDVRAVAGITFAVSRGEIFGLLGPNGAGKTTTIECLVGLRDPDEGTVRVLGIDPAVDRATVTARLAVQPQSASLFDTLTVRETLRLFASFHARPLTPDEVIEQIGLEEKSRARVKNLSGGQLRRLLLGVALISDPENVVLDEPSAGLDPAARRALWTVIAELGRRGTTVVLSTHHMDEATELCDRVGIVVGGRLVALDAPDELVRQRNADAVVSFSVGADTERALLESLGEPGTVTVDRTGRTCRVSVRTSEPDAVMRRVTFTGGVSASDFAIRRGTLEELFLELSVAPESFGSARGNR
ncbi:ABC transporter ATP-binding protein [Cellulosimicrobium marinum]|uniref:ABC transporter ATP-binding protein n=1 Tax=Cellulosimicrobium marinum TaxID=1638992 RepID=UPI001E4783D6|nr:ABC transporter ATP-binding protein [Cellulosimicrobium marinum]MCB7136947.1 ABC transporter ATP-binding protein [Cellulosimicrobium marinum]